MKRFYISFIFSGVTTVNNIGGADLLPLPATVTSPPAWKALWDPAGESPGFKIYRYAEYPSGSIKSLSDLKLRCCFPTSVLDTD